MTVRRSDMELRHLRHLVVLAEAGSFHRAARRLGFVPHHRVAVIDGPASRLLGMLRDGMLDVCLLPVSADQDGRDTAGFTDTGWQRLSAGDGAKGPRLYGWAHKTYASLQDGWCRGLLVRRSIAEPDEVTCYLTTQAAAGMDACDAMMTSSPG